MLLTRTRHFSKCGPQTNCNFSDLIGKFSDLNARKKHLLKLKPVHLFTYTFIIFVDFYH